LLNLHNVREFTLDFSKRTPWDWDSFSAYWFPNLPNLARMKLKVTNYAWSQSYNFVSEDGWTMKSNDATLIEIGNRNFGTIARLSRVIAVDVLDGLCGTCGREAHLLEARWEEDWFWEAEKGTKLQRLYF
jgi:hypothetical protein